MKDFKIMPIILVAMLTIESSAFAKKNSPWLGFIYHNKGKANEESWMTGNFKSLEDCRKAILKNPHYLKSPSDYECGHDCVFNDDATDQVCEDTSR